MSMTRDEWDEQCARWRWPDGENFVVYPLGEGRVRVLDERTGVTWQVLNKEVNIHSSVPQLYRSAARDYFTAHEPKPWLEAKPGEVWNVTPAGGFPANAWVLESGAFMYENEGWNKAKDITAGRRLWPEVSDA